MTSRISKLVLAAAVAISLPAAAAASDCDHDHGRRDAAAWPAPYQGEPGPSRWREGDWRERRLERIRARLHALDVERAEFHARHAWHPRKLHRYDRAWAERRAELVRRYAALQRVAWR